MHTWVSRHSPKILVQLVWLISGDGFKSHLSDYKMQLELGTTKPERKEGNCLVNISAIEDISLFIDDKIFWQIRFKSKPYKVKYEFHVWNILK